MSLERKGKFKTPPFPEIKTINPLTTNTVPYVNMMTKVYGDFLSSKLGNPIMSFDEYLASNPLPQLQDQQQFDTALSNLGNRPQVAPKTDTRGAYDAALAEGDRRFRNVGLPSILESFGARGARYGSDVARAGANAYGDLQAALGTRAAEADIAASENFANRLLAGDSQFGNQMSQIAQILNMMANLRDVDKRYAYSDFLKDQPETYMGQAGSFLNTQPIFPNVIVGPGAIYQEKPNIWDYLGRIQQHVQGDASIAGSFMGMAGSSRALKEGEREVSAEEERRMIEGIMAAKVKKWKYTGFSKEHTGPMLEDLPEDFHFDKKNLSLVSMIGGLILTVQEQNKRIEQLESWNKMERNRVAESL